MKTMYRRSTLAVMLIMSPKVNNDYDDESKNIFYGYIPDLPILSIYIGWI